MNKEGLGIVIGMVLFSGILIAGSLDTGHLHIEVLTGVSVLLTVFVMYFFRDPERAIPEGVDNIVSPADGKVVDIREQYENEFLREKCTRVSIFLSIFNVHVNRVPVSGNVKYFRYQKGAFVNAYKRDASEINEQTVIGIENARCNILFKQIAGLIARRIVCNIREGNAVTLGERFGIIKFGSRVDIFFPKNVDLKVKLRENVKGGQSIIGVIKT